MPALVRYTDTADHLYLFFKEVGSGAQDIVAKKMASLDLNTPGNNDWEMETAPGTPLETTYGDAAASSFEDSERDDADCVYVVYADNGTNQHAKAWRFEPTDPGNVDTNIVVGAELIVESETMLDDRTWKVSKRPLASNYRDSLHVVVFGKRKFWESLQEEPDPVILHTRCELVGNDDCGTWSWQWPLQGAASTFPFLRPS